MKNDCNTIQDLLLDGSSLGPDASEHLNNCPDCSTLADDLSSVRTAFSPLHGLEAPVEEGLVRARVLHALKPSVVRLPLAPAISTFALAASLVMAVGLAWLASPPDGYRGGSEIDVSVQHRGIEEDTSILRVRRNGGVVLEWDGAEGVSYDETDEEGLPLSEQGNPADTQDDRFQDPRNEYGKDRALYGVERDQRKSDRIERPPGESVAADGERGH